MSLRSIVRGCLGAAVLLSGCFVEDPVPMMPPTSTSASEGTDGPTAGPDTSETMTSMGPTTNGPTTDDPTTMGTITTTGVDDTTTDDPTVTETDSGGCGMACEGVACGMVEGCAMACGMCGPMATCAEDQSYCGLSVGYPNDFGSQGEVFTEVQFGHRIQVFEARVVRQLGVIAASAGLDVRMALYDHDGTGPANRIAQTGVVTLYANGTNVFNLGATPIEPGEYWVMMHTSAPTEMRRTFNMMPSYELGYRTNIPFAMGFPDTMDDEIIEPEFRYNLFMVVEE